MARHARDNGNVADKRAALGGASPKAYSHSDQIGGTRRREADGRWVDREQNPAPQKPRAQEDKRETPGEFIARNAVYILSVVAVVLIAVLLVFGVRMFSDLTTPITPSEPEGYVSPYDWSKLDRTNGRYAYVENGKVKSRLGIDVADHQSDVDWNAVRNDGIDFVMIRLGYRGATEGDLYIDDYYEQNITGAKAAGLDCGIYFFSQAITVEEAVEEADFVLANLNGMRLEYPIAFDSEVVTSLGITRTADLSNEELTNIADAFCDRIEAAGYRTLVYGNAGDLRSYDIDAMTGRGIWWAEYDTEYPSHYTDIVMWQYTGSGEVDGIGTHVDMNIDLSGVL